MTVLRKSKCGWCQETYTWWDKFLDSGFAYRWFWYFNWIGKPYLNFIHWSSRYSNKWHRRFH